MSTCNDQSPLYPGGYTYCTEPLGHKTFCTDGEYVWRHSSRRYDRDEDKIMDDLFTAARLALEEMRHTVAPRNSFTDAVDALDAAISEYPNHFVLDEADMCAILRVLFRGPISTEGTSGPRVHDLLKRIQRHLGPARYAEFVSGAWPERLK